VGVIPTTTEPAPPESVSPFVTVNPGPAVVAPPARRRDR